MSIQFTKLFITLCCVAVCKGFGTNIVYVNLHIIVNVKLFGQDFGLFFAWFYSHKSKFQWEMRVKILYVQM